MAECSCIRFACDQMLADQRASGCRKGVGWRVEGKMEEGSFWYGIQEQGASNRKVSDFGIVSAYRSAWLQAILLFRSRFNWIVLDETSRQNVFSEASINTFRTKCGELRILSLSASVVTFLVESSAIGLLLRRRSSPTGWNKQHEDGTT